MINILAVRRFTLLEMRSLKVATRTCSLSGESPPSSIYQNQETLTKLGITLLLYDRIFLKLKRLAQTKLLPNRKYQRVEDAEKPGRYRFGRTSKIQAEYVSHRSTHTSAVGVDIKIEAGDHMYLCSEGLGSAKSILLRRSNLESKTQTNFFRVTKTCQFENLYAYLSEQSNL